MAEPTEEETAVAPAQRTVIDGEVWAARVVWAAVGAEVALVALNYLFNYYDIAGDISIRRIFNIAREQSVPTFFASLQAFAVGLTALAVGQLTIEAGVRRAWRAVGVFWCYVGIDDNAEIHERVGSALRRATEGSSLVDWWPTFSWQLFLAPILAVGLLGSVIVAWRSAHRRRWLLIACLATMAVAQGIDVLEGIDGLFDDWADALAVEPYTVGHGMRSIEETLEMLATTAFWAVALDVLVTRVRGSRVEFT